MNIRPLKGQCLIELYPPSDLSAGGVVIPETANPAGKGNKLPPVKGMVRRMGPWPQKPNGYCVLPEFTPGDTVLVSQYSGVEMRSIGPRYRMVRVEDVIAVLVDSPGDCS